MRGISIIIPTYNEGARIGALVQQLLQRNEEGKKAGDIEAIVVDGGSTDDTVTEAKRAGARVIFCECRQRARQMNMGAKQARGEMLYFLHADTTPPDGFAHRIVSAFAAGYVGGAFCIHFDAPHPTFHLSTAWSRVPITINRYGDQSLFVRRDVFVKIGCFREDMAVFEDQEIFTRLKKAGKFTVLSPCVVTSARKFVATGVMRLHFVYFLLTLLYRLGVSQERLMLLYRMLVPSMRR